MSFDLNETQHLIWNHESEIELVTSGLKLVENILKLIVPKNCPIEKSGYFYILEKCYFFSSEKTKWDLAKVNCTNIYPDGQGKLFEPQNKDMSDLVRKKQLKYFNSSEVRLVIIHLFDFPEFLLRTEYLEICLVTAGPLFPPMLEGNRSPRQVKSAAIE